jgi:hypothetical protein
MSRGFDGFEVDDFRDSDWESDAQRESYDRESFGFGRERGSKRGAWNGSAQSRRRLEQFREAESNSDRTNGRRRVKKKFLTLDYTPECRLRGKGGKGNANRHRRKEDWGQRRCDSLL